VPLIGIAYGKTLMLQKQLTLTRSFVNQKSLCKWVNTVNFTQGAAEDSKHIL